MRDSDFQPPWAPKPLNRSSWNLAWLTVITSLQGVPGSVVAVWPFGKLQIRVVLGSWWEVTWERYRRSVIGDNNHVLHTLLPPQSQACLNIAIFENAITILWSVCCTMTSANWYSFPSTHFIICRPTLHDAVFCLLINDDDDDDEDPNFAHYHKSSQENVFSGVRPSVNIYGTNIHHVHDCALLKRFSRSGVKGQGHDQSM